jgi:hypothetical protein
MGNIRQFQTFFTLVHATRVITGVDFGNIRELQTESSRRAGVGRTNM